MFMLTHFGVFDAFILTIMVFLIWASWDINLSKK